MSGKSTQRQQDWINPSPTTDAMAGGFEQPFGNAMAMGGMEGAEPAYGNGMAAESLLGSAASPHALADKCGPNARSPGETVGGAFQQVLSSGLAMAGELGIPGAGLAGAGLDLLGVWDAAEEIQECAPYVTRERDGKSYDEQHDEAQERANNGLPPANSQLMDYLECLDDPAKATYSSESKGGICQNEVYGE